MARPRKEKVVVQAPMDMDDLLQKGNAFITSMTLLSNAAEEVSVAASAFLDALISYENSMNQLQSQSVLHDGPIEAPEVFISGRKRAKRAKRDPAMPKRPMNAYFIFYHQGKDAVKAELGPNATHKQLVAEMGKRWSDTAENQKQVWRDMYQKSLEVYVKDLELYNAKDATKIGESSTLGITGLAELDHVVESDEDNHRADVFGEAEIGAEEDDDTEDSDEEEPVIRPPPPPPRRKATLRGKKAETTDTSFKGMKDSLPISASSPITVGTKEKAQPVKRKRASRKKVIAEEETFSDEFTL